MKTLTLYTGGGVSLTTIWKEGMTKSAYVRLAADDGKALRKGDVITYSVDVLPEDAASWTEIDDPGPEPDADEILDILLGGDIE